LGRFKLDAPLLAAGHLTPAGLLTEEFFLHYRNCAVRRVHQALRRKHFFIFLKIGKNNKNGMVELYNLYNFEKGRKVFIDKMNYS